MLKLKVFHILAGRCFLPLLLIVVELEDVSILLRPTEFSQLVYIPSVDFSHAT